MMMGNMGDWGPMGWVWSIVGFLFMATFFVGVILLIFYGIRALGRSGGGLGAVPGARPRPWISPGTAMPGAR